MASYPPPQRKNYALRGERKREEIAMGRMEHPLRGPEGPPADRVDRRDFLKVCMIAAATVGLPASVGRKWAEAAQAGLKPSVIWLHFQECTGCTE